MCCACHDVCWAIGQVSAVLLCASMLIAVCQFIDFFRSDVCRGNTALAHCGRAAQISLRCNALGLIDPPGRQQVSALKEKVTALEEKATEAETLANSLRTKLRVSGPSFGESCRRTA